MSQQKSLSPFEAAIVRACAAAVENSMENPIGHRVHFLDRHVVKFNETDLLHEGDTQTFVYTALEGLSGAPHVPEVCACFEWSGMQYLVMERVNLPDGGDLDRCLQGGLRSPSLSLRRLRSCERLHWFDRRKFARQQSAQVLAGSGYARHFFFGVDFTAPHRYASAHALELHVNKALTYRPRRSSPLTVEISDERLVLVHGDIKPCNFLIDPSTLHATLIDFGGISVLPASFISLSLHARTDRFIRGISECLNWEESKNLPALKEAAGIYAQLGNKRLGLDEHGASREVKAN
ncbi:hypothetical protein B0H14DRAFT_2910034 [Mycena olivaceomarginata]|nr:hypothetical protein B0H14DRAFT_2910034 [Mycena olivaceomarginata]